MSFRGRGGFGRGGGGGNFRGGGGRGRGGGRPSFGGGNRSFDMGPPEKVIELGHFIHTSQDDLVVKVNIEDVPYFNSPIYLENKEQIGKIDEIFGNIRNYMVSVKLGEGMKAESFRKGQTLYCDPRKILPLSRFLPQPPGQRGGGRGRGGRGRGGRGGFGGGFGGRGGGGRGGGGGGGFRGRGGGGFGGRGFGGGGGGYGGRGGGYRGH